MITGHTADDLWCSVAAEQVPEQIPLGCPENLVEGLPGDAEALGDFGRALGARLFKVTPSSPFAARRRSRPTVPTTVYRPRYPSRGVGAIGLR
ncbi:hypothetical protein [Natronomonas moolapensis]|nr:hypothetical protein [Natronomonas moolapensis]